MPVVPFLAFTAAGSFLWNTVLVYAGRIAGDSWEKVSAAFGVYSDLFLMVAGISVTFAVLFRGCGERKRRDNPGDLRRMQMNVGAAS